jgi:hypothetical protein
MSRSPVILSAKKAETNVFSLVRHLKSKRYFINVLTLGLSCTECGRNNSHISKNNCGVPKADSGVWSIPLGRVHNKVFSRRHAVVG